MVTDSQDTLDENLDPETHEPVSDGGYSYDIKNSGGGKLGGSQAGGVEGVFLSGASAVLGYIYGPAASEAVNKISEVIGDIQKISALYKVISGLLNTVNAKNAAKFMKLAGGQWGSLASAGTKDYEVCAWNGNTGTCGGRTATRLRHVALSAGFTGPEKGLVFETIDYSVYKIFGNISRRNNAEKKLSSAWKKWQESGGVPVLDGRAGDVMDGSKGMWEDYASSMSVAQGIDASKPAFTMRELNTLAKQLAVNPDMKINLLSGAMLIAKNQVVKLARLVSQFTAAAAMGGISFTSDESLFASSTGPDPFGVKRSIDIAAKNAKEESGKSTGTAIMVAALAGLIAIKAAGGK